MGGSSSTSSASSPTPVRVLKFYPYMNKDKCMGIRLKCSIQMVSHHDWYPLHTFHTSLPWYQSLVCAWTVNEIVLVLCTSGYQIAPPLFFSTCIQESLTPIRLGGRRRTRWKCEDLQQGGRDGDGRKLFFFFFKCFKFFLCIVICGRCISAAPCHVWQGACECPSLPIPGASLAPCGGSSRSSSSSPGTPWIPCGQGILLSRQVQFHIPALCLLFCICLSEFADCWCVKRIVRFRIWGLGCRSLGHARTLCNKH